MDINNLNIPNKTVNGVIKLLHRMMGDMIEGGVSPSSIPSVFLWGPMGIGKTEGVYQLGDKLAKRLKNKKVAVTVICLSNYGRTDLTGIPVPDAKREFANWLKPRIFDISDSEDTINIIFLDELSAVHTELQTMAYQICHERRVAEHQLPSNCIVIAAGNRMTDMSVSYKLSKALCNRLLHFNVVSDYEQWRKWAVKNGIAPQVIAYLGFDSSRLNTSPETADLAFTTPRSWSFVSLMMNNVQFGDEMDNELIEMIASAVGVDVAIEFAEYCKNIQSMPSIDTIFKGCCAEKPKNSGVLYALVSGLVSRIKPDIAIEKLDNACSYMMQFPRDYLTMFLCDIKEIEGINEKLARCPSVQYELSKKNGRI